MMVDIVFYEKPGCINNTRQKKLLLEAGHQLEVRDLLKEQWTRGALREFFGDMPVDKWFNSSAPDIKSGKIEPAENDEESALELMIANPILICRPLMRVADKCWVGFDSELVDKWIGLNKVTDKEDLESCPQKDGHHCSITALKTSE